MNLVIWRSYHSNEISLITVIQFASRGLINRLSLRHSYCGNVIWIKELEWDLTPCLNNMLPVGVLYLTQNWGWCSGTLGVCTTQTFWNPIAHLETSTSMVKFYACSSYRYHYRQQIRYDLYLKYEIWFCSTSTGEKQ